MTSTAPVIAMQCGICTHRIEVSSWPMNDVRLVVEHFAREHHGDARLEAESFIEIIHDTSSIESEKEK